MPAMKRETIHAMIRSQLMKDPQNGVLLLLNLMKLFADRKDDAEFIKELADIASELTSSTLEASYPQPALFRQPVMVQPMTEYPNISKIPAPNQNFQEKLPTPPQVVAGDVMSALNELGQDTASYQTQKNEPLIQGYREWTPKPKKK
ncbi:MAG: hypothetical protein K2G88_08320 [Oscillospiraceae bacterium]|nr:hypothetical protein [Oscillospiraceae bacterium]